MISRLIRLAMGHKWLVLVVTCALAAAGVWAFRQESIDAYPDISAMSVQIICTFPGRAAEEIEQQVTVPIELAMRSVPRVAVVRSRTIFGLSVVQLIFEEGVDMYWARQRVQENLAQADLPAGADARLGPLGTPAGELYRYELASDGGQSLMELRELNDWVVLPRLLRVPGVADVTIFGGDAKQFAVVFQPAQLTRYGLTLSNVIDAVQANNASAGGSVLNRGSMSFVIRGAGTVKDARQIENIFVKSVGGTPVYLKDIATVQVAARTPSGVYSKDGADYSVEGIVVMRRGENPSQILAGVKAAIDELNSVTLPRGVRIVPFYNRETLVQGTVHTVAHSVLLGVTLVVLVLLLFLGRPSMAALVALTIPFALLLAILQMWAAGIPIGLLSIGAIDFGIIVDGAIIMAENISRRLAEATEAAEAAAPGMRPDVDAAVLRAALEVERPVFFSILMIVVAYLPLLSLTSIEGLLFRPMALTMVFALFGALFFALLVVPVLASLFFRTGYEEWENPLQRWVRQGYVAALGLLLRGRWLTVAATACLLAFVLVRVAPLIGVEFLPYMDEGVVWVRANFPEGTSLEQTHAFGKEIRAIARGFRDVEYVSVQAGRNDSNTEPFPPSRLEMMIVPRPREDWTEFPTKQALVAALRGKLQAAFPTTRFNFTQPIIDNVAEDTNGTSANLAVEVSGADPTVLRELGVRTVDLLKSVPGAVDVSIEQEGPQPQLLIAPDRALCARYNVRVEEVNRLINTALGGEPVGRLYEGERRFDIVVKADRSVVNSPQALGRVPVYTPDGQPVPLGQVADIKIVDGQTLIARENGRRRITVRCDIVGRDQGGFVAEAQRRFAEEVRVPPGVNIEWIGLFANLQHARDHFAVVLPVSILLIVLLLLVTFRSLKAALLLLLSMPFAFLGGVLALYVRGMNLNVSTGVGFAALFGVSIMNGVLMVRAITVLRQEGRSLDAAILEGARDCLRPILLASMVAILGLVPASLATGLGSDVQRPLATVIVWGLMSSTVLTLFVVPVFYRLFRPSVASLAVLEEHENGGGPGPDLRTGQSLDLAGGE